MEESENKHSESLGLTPNANRSFVKFVVILLIYLLVVPFAIFNLTTIFLIAIFIFLIPFITNIIGFIQGLRSYKLNENTWKKPVGTYGNLILLLLQIVAFVFLFI